MIRFKNIQIIIVFAFFFLKSFQGYSTGKTDFLPDTVQSMSDIEQVKYLGKLCWELNAKNNDLAVAYGEYALNLADSLHFYGEASEISNYLGVAMLYYQNNIKKAWYYFRQALDHGIHANDSVEIGYAYDNIGYMYFLHGNLTSALEYYNDAFAIFESMDFQQGLAYVYTSIGLVKNAEEKYSEALMNYNKALELHTKLSNKPGLAAVHSCIGETYLKQHNYSEAEEEFEKQVEFSQQLDNDKYLAEGLKGIANVWYHQNDFLPALEFINKAINIANTKNDTYLLIEARIVKALILAGLNRFEQGEQQLKMAFNTAKKLGLPQKIYEVYEGYASFYDEAGNDIRKNYSIYGDLFGVYDSLYREYEKEKLINEEQRIEIANNLDLAREKLKQKRKQQLYSFAVVFLLFVVGFILYWRYITSKKLTSKLAAANEELNDTIAKKNDALNSLKKSEQELKESNATKSRLFSIIAHDLKSPFQSILGFSELLLYDHKSIDEDTRDSHIRNMHDGLQRVYNLLDNLLIWSATQNNKIQFSPEKVNVSQAISGTVELHAIFAKNKGIQLDVEIEENIYLEVDLNLLNTIIRNLLSNAVKFTPSGGTIRVQAMMEQNNNVFLFSVADTGVGIPEKQLSELFSEGKNTTTAGTNAEKGTGLGLQLCYDLVKLHGGRIWAESEINKGSRFTFTIPVKF